MWFCRRRADSRALRKTVEVLFEEARQFGLDTYVTGFTREYVKVAVKETEENRDMLTPGTVRTVKITGRSGRQAAFSQPCAQRLSAAYGMYGAGR